MLNQDGIRKKSYANAVQILANVDLQSSVGCIVPSTFIPEAGANGRKIVKAGTPININLMNRALPVVPVSPGANPESATATVTGTGVTSASVVAATFGTKVSGVSGNYEFTYVEADTKWKLDGANANLVQYGITVEGTAANGDKITVVYTAAEESTPMNAVLLHDVDITNGNANGTALVFGFVNLKRADSEVATAITTAMAIEGSSKLLTFLNE